MVANNQVVTLSTAQLNQIFPQVGINPTGVSALAAAASKYPANDFTVGDSQPNRLLNTAGFRFNAPESADLNSHVAKLDWNITSKQSAFVRANPACVQVVTHVAQRIPAQRVATGSQTISHRQHSIHLVENRP